MIIPVRQKGLIQIQNNSLRGFGTLEYLALLMMICALFIMSSQLVRNGIQGYYRRSGEGFAYLRQHDPRRTRDCLWEPQLTVWYSEKCFDYYSRKFPPAADSVTDMRCRQDLSRTSCSSGTFAGICPTTCQYAQWKMGTCSAPCAYLSPPSPL